MQIMGHVRQFAVGLDLGAQESSLAVYDQRKQCSMPIEVQAAKTIPTCVAFEPKGDSGDFITGKRAESRYATPGGPGGRSHAWPWSVLLCAPGQRFEWPSFLGGEG